MSENHKRTQQNRVAIFYVAAVLFAFLLPSLGCGKAEKETLTPQAQEEIRQQHIEMQKRERSNE